MEFVPPPTGPILPSLLKYRLQHKPDDIFTVFPGDNGTLSSISYRELGRACRRFAHAMNMYSLTHCVEVVGLLLVCDTLLYQTAICSLAQMGITVFPISPRLPPHAVYHLLRSASVHRILTTPKALNVLLSALAIEASKTPYDLVIEGIPSLDQVYPSKPEPSYIDVSSDDLGLPRPDAYMNAVEIWLHSSGTTGLPKAIPLSHEYLHKLKFSQNYQQLAEKGSSIVMNAALLPTFHLMGILTQIVQPLMTGTTSSILRPNFPEPPMLPTPQNILAAMQDTCANAACVVPAYLELWAHDASAIDFLKSLVFIYFGGGPLATASGDKLVACGVNILSAYGLTECGPMSNAFRDIGTVDDWAWIQFSNHVTTNWAHQGNGMYELQVLATGTQPLAVTNLSRAHGYATGDLFAKHPTIEGLWKIVGRSDDLIVMSNGEKTIPAPLESALLAQPAVKGAVAFGQGQDRIGVLIELKEDIQSSRDITAMRNLLWPIVQHVNRDVPAFSRVFKDMLIFANSSKPLPRTAKGTVNQKNAWSLYANEISEVYALANAQPARLVTEPREHSKKGLEAWLVGVISLLLPDQLSIDVNQDLFARGLDSLTATLLRNHIVQAMSHLAAPRNLEAITSDFVYVNPTVTRLADTIHYFLEPGPEPLPLNTDVGVCDMIVKYTHGIPPSIEGAETDFPKYKTVLLTGSTGGLGSELLRILLVSERISHIYVLNRPSLPGKTSQCRQSDAFIDRGFDAACLSSSRLVFLEGDASQPYLGLDAAAYDELRKTVDVVIHNAWRLNFNLTLASFEDNISASRRVVDLAVSSPHASRVRVLLMSSVAVGQSWQQHMGLHPLPEDTVDRVETCLGGGYGESKYVAEQIFARARRQGLQTTCVRIGQITGGKPAGAWAITDWLPILVKSSVALGYLPDAKGVVAWVEPAIVAQAVIDVALGEPTTSPALNITHPRPIHWSDMISYVLRALRDHQIVQTTMSLVSFREWYSMLKERNDVSNMSDLPALKLLPFFHRLAVSDEGCDTVVGQQAMALGATTFMTANSRRVSPALDGAKPISFEDVSNWVHYWKRKGLFC